MTPNSITETCSGCLRQFTLPMLSKHDEKMGQAPKNPEYVLTCVCGTENRFALMAVLPFPLHKEASVA